MAEAAILQEAMRELSSALARAVGATQPVAHNLLKGEMRERRVLTGLRPLIPLRYSLGSGIVVNAAERYSRQVDLIIADTTRSAPFLAAGDMGVYPVESINASIEIKSDATAATIAAAVENIRSVKSLQTDALRPFMSISGATMGMGEMADKPFGGAIFLGTSISSDALLTAFVNACAPVPTLDRPHAIVVVGRCALQWASLTDDTRAVKRIEPLPNLADGAVCLELGDRALLSFYLTLMRVLDAYQPPPLDLVPYANAAGGFGQHAAIVRQL